MPSGSRDRRLATVLFLDIVGSTHIASDMGDRRWRELLTRFRKAVRGELRRFGGHEEDTAGDGLFATFQQPASAIRAAEAIVEAVHQHGIDVRCGVHFGECEVVEGKLGGIAVHIGARVMSVAGPAEIVATSTVRDLVAGAGVEFDDLSMHELKGVPGTWQLFSARRIDGRSLPKPLTGKEAAARIAEVQPPGVLGRRRPVLVGAGVIFAAVMATVLVLTLSGGGGASPAPHAPHRSHAPLVLHEAVVRLSPATGKVLTTTTNVLHGGFGGIRRMAFGEARVWVVGYSRLFAIDPSTGHRTPFRGGGHDVAAGDHEVWVASADGSTPRFFPTVQQADPATGNMFPEVHLPGFFPNVEVRDAVGGGYVWASYSGELVRVDERSPHRTKVITRTGADFVAAGGSVVWIIDELAGTMSRVNIAAGTAGRPVTPAGSPNAVAVGPAGTWVVNSSGGFAQRIDESGGPPGDPIQVGDQPIAVAVGSRTVWVANQGSDSVSEIDAGSGTVTHTFRVPGTPVAITVDPRTDAPWVYLL